jgi:lipoxygenase homology domain-containing protein 1
VCWFRGSATDANVSIELHGSDGFIGSTRLENSSNNFQRGKVDTFIVKATNIGDIQKINIGESP